MVLVAIHLRTGLSTLDGVRHEPRRIWTGEWLTVTPEAEVVSLIDRSSTQLALPSAQLIRESSEQLSINPVIHPGRADVIAGGAVVVNGIMTLLAEEADVHTMTISEKDILDGIIAELAGE